MRGRFALLLALQVAPTVGAAQVMPPPDTLRMADSLALEVRAVPPDAFAAWCVPTWIIRSRGLTAVLFDGRREEAGYTPPCRDHELVLLVRPWCLFTPGEFASTRVKAPAVVLVCGPRVLVLPLRSSSGERIAVASAT